MKKIISTILAAALCLSLTACETFGKGKPDDIGAAYYAIGLKVVEECDKYLNVEISAKEAGESIEDLCDRFDELSGEPNDFERLLVASADLLGIMLQNLGCGIGDHTYEEVLAERNKIALSLNEKAWEYSREREYSSTAENFSRDKTIGTEDTISASSVTRDSIIDFLQEKQVASGGEDVVFITETDLDDGGKVYHYRIPSSTSIFPSTSLLIDTDASGRNVIDITLMSSHGELLNADGASDRTVNLEYVRNVNMVVLMLDENIDLDAFDEKYKLLDIASETESITGEIEGWTISLYNFDTTLTITFIFTGDLI